MMFAKSYTRQAWLNESLRYLKGESVDHVAKSCLTHQPFGIGLNFTKGFNFLKRKVGVEFLYLFV